LRDIGDQRSKEASKINEGGRGRRELQKKKENSLKYSVVTEKIICGWEGLGS